MKALSKIFGFLFFLLGASFLFAKDDFHPPKTDIEKRLDKIIRGSFKGDLDSYIRTFPHLKPKSKVRSNNFLTARYVIKWSRMEKNEVDKTCNGKYRKDLVCGLNYNFVAKGQEISDCYLMKTICEEQNKATIETKFSPESHVVTYFLKKERGLWLVDDVIDSLNPVF